MRTHLIPGTAPLPDDPALMDELSRRHKDLAGKGLSLCIGIEGPGQQVYRVIDTDGFVETVQVFELLQQFGLRPRPGRELERRNMQRVFARCRAP